MPLGVEYRYFDRPMPGSIYTAPDILNVVRGPTLVRVRDRREPMRVPAQIKASKATTRRETSEPCCSSAYLEESTPLTSANKCVRLWISTDGLTNCTTPAHVSNP